MEIDLKEDISKDIKVNALFFLSTTSAELGLNDPFDFLIKNYEKDISTLLGIGLSQEGEKLKQISSDLKKYIKKFEGRIKKSHGTKALIHDLFNSPINKSEKAPK